MPVLTGYIVPFLASVYRENGFAGWNSLILFEEFVP